MAARALTDMGETLFFTASDEANSSEFWTSDGTSNRSHGDGHQARSAGFGALVGTSTSMARNTSPQMTGSTASSSGERMARGSTRR